MLTFEEMEAVEKISGILSSVKQRVALEKMISEYRQYTRLGSPEDCAQRKEWMEMSYEDIRMNFNSTIKALRQEVSDIRDQYCNKKLPKKQAGRPRKKKETEN